MAVLCSPGMPAAYDLSTVIGGGSAVSHNNLIPLGMYAVACKYRESYCCRKAPARHIL